MSEITDKKLVVSQPKRQLSLKQKVDIETDNRKVLTAFITEHMKKGVDYAPIHVAKNCVNKYACTNKYHFSKDNLTKAGAEKIRSLLRLRPETVMDRETWEMAGSRAGHFCYRCNLFDMVSGELVGDGLGACTIEEKGNLNNAIKIAKKRAFVDAILSTGSLSDFFTQDLEDLVESVEPVEKTPRQMREVIEKKESENLKEKKVDVVNGHITNGQKLEMLSLLGKKGKNVLDLNNYIKVAYRGLVDGYQNLSYREANFVLQKLKEVKEEKKEADMAKEIEEVMSEEDSEIIE